MLDGREEASAAELCPDTGTGLAGLADAMQLVTRRAAGDDLVSCLGRFVRVASTEVPGAAAASVTAARNGRVRTLASTGDAGPCPDALEDEAAPGRAWVVRADEEAGVRSVLSYRLTVLDHCETIAALNIYSEASDAFTETAVTIGLVLATQGSLLVTAMLASERADHLMRALESNREIGVAMGVLMQRHQLTRLEAFDVLRVASQDANRKLADIATEVADTGILAIRRRPGLTTPTADTSAGSRAPTHGAPPGRGLAVPDTKAGMGEGNLGQDHRRRPWSRSPERLVSEPRLSFSATNGQERRGGGGR